MREKSQSSGAFLELECSQQCCLLMCLPNSVDAFLPRGRLVVDSRGEVGH